MPKNKKHDLPHHIKERLRHQKHKELLEEVALRVPKPSNERRETKATKLRRVILYMKFLNKKRAEYHKNSHSKLDNNLNIVNQFKLEKSVEKGQSFSENEYRKAQIIFLRKSSKSIDKKENENYKGNKFISCCENNFSEEIQMNYTVTKKNTRLKETKDIFDQTSPCNIVKDSFPLKNQNENVAYKHSTCQEIKENSPKITNTYKSQCGDILSTKNSNIFSPIQNTQDTKFATNFDNISTNYDYVHSVSKDRIYNDLNRQYQVHPKFKDDYFESYKNSLDSDELSPLNNSHYYPTFQVEAEKSLPSISALSPYSFESVNISNKDDFFKHKSHQINDPFLKSETNIQMFDEMNQNELNSLKSATFSPEQNFSENIQSSSESAFFTSSNEWLSDDNINESGNLVKSSCLDSPINDNSVNIKSVPFQQAYINSDYVHHLPIDSYLYGNAQPFLLKTTSNSKYSHISPIYKAETNERNPLFMRQLDDRYPLNNTFQSWNNYDRNILLPMHFSQNTHWDVSTQYNYSRKNKSSTIVNLPEEDSCVPQYVYESNANELEEEIIDIPRFNEINGCENNPNFSLKDEYDSPLPLKENSYSFKNFSQWCTKNLFD